ncbi:MAG: hypothetical protein KatS3mg051_1436 [Anaerolineae bacterium]|nr:MAG: hypothetical protein KatS3mg051_1436 [Anaerolineae bacterium]
MKLTIADLGDTTIAVWQAIAEYERWHGYAPSFRDLVELCGLSSTSVAEYHVNRLEAAGVVRRTPGIARGMVLVRRPQLEVQP